MAMDPKAVIDSDAKAEEKSAVVEEENLIGLALVCSDGDWRAIPLDGVSHATEEDLFDFCWQYVGLRIRPMSVDESTPSENTENE
tara:strand:+ start:152 stop:406 length:255 start_codon:yes stop_codon:yes gene_type:complete